MARRKKKTTRRRVHHKKVHHHKKANRKKRGGKIPLAVLEARLDRLVNTIRRRGGGDYVDYICS